MIALITYDAPHRKTQDVLFHLILNGYTDLSLIIIPWVSRKKHVPVFQHRPSSAVETSIEALCENLNIQFERVSVEGIADVLNARQFEYIMIAGAGILPKEIPESFDVINAHPGYLPNVRGLDSLKWALYHQDPVGVTTHYISANTDEGRLIERKEVPIYFEDSFHSLAYRVYETEIKMLVNSIELLKTNNAPLTDLSDNRYEANRRMSHKDEMMMMEKFEVRRRNAKSIRNDQ